MERAVVLFDAECGFCRWSVVRLLSFDRRGRLRAVPLQDPEADRLLGAMAPERKAASWHLVTPDGKVRSGDAAVAPLLRLLPGGAAAGALASAFPGTIERAYGWTARNRGRLGRRLRSPACPPAPPSSAARSAWP